jgi:hypothetical protein
LLHKNSSPSSPPFPPPAGRLLLFSSPSSSMGTPFLFPLPPTHQNRDPHCCKFDFAAASLVVKPQYIEGEKLLSPSFSVQSMWAATMIISVENRCCLADRCISRHYHHR